MTSVLYINKNVTLSDNINNRQLNVAWLFTVHMYTDSLQTLIVCFNNDIA